jgi:hypothetical protein
MAHETCRLLQNPPNDATPRSDSIILTTTKPLIFQCKIFRYTVDNRLLDPSEIYALEFKAGSPLLGFKSSRGGIKSMADDVQIYSSKAAR